jgi:hypothetical protein
MQFAAKDQLLAIGSWLCLGAHADFTSAIHASHNGPSAIFHAGVGVQEVPSTAAREGIK